MKRSAQQVCTMRYEERTIAGEGPVHHIAIPGWSPRDQLLQMAWGTLKAVYDRIEYCRRVSMVAEYEPRPFELEPARSRVTPLPAAACTSRPNKLPGGDTFREFLAWLQRNPTGGSYIRMQMEIDAVALGATTDRADRLPPPSPNGLDDLLESLSLVNASFAMFVKMIDKIDAVGKYIQHHCRSAAPVHDSVWNIDKVKTPEPKRQRVTLDEVKGETPTKQQDAAHLMSLDAGRVVCDLTAVYRHCPIRGLFRIRCEAGQVYL